MVGFPFPAERFPPQKFIHFLESTAPFLGSILCGRASFLSFYSFLVSLDEFFLDHGSRWRRHASRRMGLFGGSTMDASLACV